MRQLSEAECYIRLYGRDEENVRIIRVGLERPHWAPRLTPLVEGSLPRRGRSQGGPSGEELRASFEKRLDARDPEADEWAA
jgi:hypothetical protein